MLLRRISFKSILVALFFVLLASGILFSTQYWQKQIVSVVLYPILVVENTVIHPIKQWLYWRRGVADLRAIALQYEKENRELLSKNIELEACLEFVKESKELVEFKNRYDTHQGVIGHIVLKNFSPQEHFFLVGVGASRGIKKDMVAVYKNNLIGRVSEVYPWYCKVLLLTDHKCHVAATCVKTGAHGIHMGNNSIKKTSMGFVNHLDAVSEGDLIISHGKGLIFPRGFALGRVELYHQEGVQYNISVAPLIDLKTIEFCTIISKTS